MADSDKLTYDQSNRTVNPTHFVSMKKSKETNEVITVGAVIALFIMSGIFWFLVMAQLLSQETYPLHWECNGTQFDLEIVAKSVNLKCL